MDIADPNFLVAKPKKPRTPAQVAATQNALAALKGVGAAAMGAGILYRPDIDGLRAVAIIPVVLFFIFLAVRLVERKSGKA